MLIAPVDALILIPVPAGEFKLKTPALATVIEPAPFVIVIPEPCVNAAATGAAPVDPIKSCPFVGAAVVVSKPPVPEYKNELAVNPVSVKLVPVVPTAGSV